MYDRVSAEPNEDTFKDYRIKVHAMKNSAAMCGALQVSSLARVLEFAARDMDWNTMVSLMPVFEKEWTRLKELLDVAFVSSGTESSNSPDEESKEETAKPAIDQNLFGQYLDSLENAMEELDTDTADALIEEFLQYRFETDIQEIIDELAVAVKNLDSEAAKELIAKLKQS